MSECRNNCIEDFDVSGKFMARKIHILNEGFNALFYAHLSSLGALANALPLSPETESAGFTH